MAEQLEIAYGDRPPTRGVWVRVSEEVATQGDILNSPKAVVESVRALGIAGQECFMVIGMNSRNEEIARKVIAVGTVDQAAVYPREVARWAILSDATAVIFIHNHPSGNLRPSSHDREITRVLKDALKTLDITTHDHLIITRGGYLSFREEGLI